MAKDIQVISRIISILDALSERDAASLRDLSIATGLPMSTTSRLLDSLETHGFVEREYASKAYYLGRGLLRFSAGVRRGRDIASVLHGILEELSNETGEDAGLAELQGSNAVFIDRVEGRHALRIIDVINRPEPLYCGAFRKVLLAFQSDDWIKHYVETTKFISFTDNTIKNRSELWKEISRIRAQGYAISIEERHSDAAGVAAPIFDNTAKIRAAAHIVGPTTRINLKTIVRYASVVKKAADAATRLLTGREWSARDQAIHPPRIHRLQNGRVRF